MKNEIRNHVEVLFDDVPKTKRAFDLKEELITNLEARYDDLIASGAGEQEAFKTTVNGIGDVEELLSGLREPTVFDEASYQEQRRKDAKVVTISIALYFLAIVALFICAAIAESPSMMVMNEVTGIPSSNESLEIFGLILMFAIAVVPTCMLIYHYTSRPVYKKQEETIVEEFKEWSSDSKRAKAVRGAVSSVLWTLTVVLYFLLSFTTGAWHLTWMVFLASAALESLISLYFNLKLSSSSPAASHTQSEGSITLDESKENGAQANNAPTQESTYNKTIKAIIGASSTILWMITVMIYIFLSFSTGAWHVTWIVFLIASCMQALIKLVGAMKMK